MDSDETSEWRTNFVLVPKASGKVRLCFDLAWLNKVLVRTNLRGPTLSILPRLKGVKYLTLFDVSSGYHNL